MKTITVLAWRRPLYLQRVLWALSECRGIEGYEVYVSVDDASSFGKASESVQVATRCASLFADEKYAIWPQKKKFGIDEHPKHVYDLIFSSTRVDSDFNVMLEDDVLPSPDFLELADWFYNLPQRDEYCSLHMYSPLGYKELPTAMLEMNQFNCWGWATTREMWNRWWGPNWNCKRVPPTGWDWSCGYVVEKNGLRALHPFLSRVLNIGREGGTHDFPENWDRTQAHIVASDGSFGKDFQITYRVPDGEFRLSDWAIPESEMNDAAQSKVG